MLLVCVAPVTVKADVPTASEMDSADNAPVVNTWSAGCQTIPKNHYGSFLSSVGQNPSFFYVLIDGQ